eukprot:4288035-Lingulodinium_polyedra.AAC.1
MRRSPHGARRMECADRDMRGAAAVECISERNSEQFSRESCSAMRSEMRPTPAAPRRHMVVDVRSA